VSRAPVKKGARNVRVSQDVLDFAGASKSAALVSVFLAGVVVDFAGFGLNAAAALAVRSLKDMSSIL
jgi:hypothetical protein